MRRASMQGSGAISGGALQYGADLGTDPLDELKKHRDERSRNLDDDAFVVRTFVEGEKTKAPKKKKDAAPDRFFDSDDVPDYLRAAGRTPEEVNAYARRMEGLLRMVAQDSAPRFVPGEWWAYNPKSDVWTYPVLEMMNRPDPQVRAICYHEPAHRIWTRYFNYPPPFDPEKEPWLVAPFWDLNNAIEDIRINEFQMTRWPGLEPDMAELYQAEFSDEAVEARLRKFAQAAEAEGATPQEIDRIRSMYRGGPKSEQFKLGMISRWAGQRFRYGTEDRLDDDVRKAISTHWSSVEAAAQFEVDPDRDIFKGRPLMHPEVQARIDRFARQSYDTICGEIWPTYRRLLEQSIEDLAGQAGGGGSQATDADRKRAREIIGRVHEDAADKTRPQGHGQAGNETDPKDEEKCEETGEAPSSSKTGQARGGKGPSIRDLIDPSEMDSRNTRRVERQLDDIVSSAPVTEYDEVRKEFQKGIRAYGQNLQLVFERMTHRRLDPTLRRRGTILNVNAYSEARAGKAPPGTPVRLYNNLTDPTEANAGLVLSFDNSQSMGAFKTAMRKLAVFNMEAFRQGRIPFGAIKFDSQAEVMKPATLDEIISTKRCEAILSQLTVDGGTTNDVDGMVKVIGQLELSHADESIVLVFTDGRGNVMTDPEKLAAWLGIDSSHLTNQVAIQALCRYAESHYRAIIYGCAVGDCGEEVIEYVKASYPRFLQLPDPNQMARIVQRTIMGDFERMRARREGGR